MISFVIQHSWQYFIYYRCQNVNRKSRNDEIQPRKKPKFDDKLPAHVCPPIHAEDEVSFGRHLEVLNTERQKPKPRLEVLKDMMRRTFPNQSQYTTNTVRIFSRVSTPEEDLVCKLHAFISQKTYQLTCILFLYMYSLARTLHKSARKMQFEIVLKKSFHSGHMQSSNIVRRLK